MGVIREENAMQVKGRKGRATVEWHVHGDTPRMQLCMLLMSGWGQTRRRRVLPMVPPPATPATARSPSA
jgi:hypothetical protein